MNRYEETDAVVRLEDRLERIMRERDMLREALDYIYENEGSRDYTTVSVESFRRAREALKVTEGK